MQELAELILFDKTNNLRHYYTRPDEETLLNLCERHDLDYTKLLFTLELVHPGVHSVGIDLDVYRAAQESMCHCGRPVHIYDEPGMKGFSRGMCEPCSTVRCDTVEYTFSGDAFMPPCPPR